MRNLPLRSVLSFSGFALAVAALPAATLHVLPSYSAGGYDYAVGLADNGLVIGNSQDFESSAPVIWSKVGSAYPAAQALPLPSNADGGELRWTSADASLLAGYAALPLVGDEVANYSPVVWSRLTSGVYTAATLPVLGGAPSETLISGGSTTGSRFVGQSGATPVATVWRGATGSAYTAQALALPTDAAGTSRAASLSADGARAVGYYETAAGAQALAWTESSGTYSVAKLQTLAGGAQSFAETISRDGTFAAGASETATGLLPVRWNTTTGAATALQTLSGSEATVLAIADNNLWLGGRATDSETFESSAVLWNSSGQIFDLVSLASSAGADFAGLTPESVTGIHLTSTGLYTVVGTGSTPEGATQAYVLENLALAGAPSALEAWRQTHFGSSAGTGDAADNADPDHDGQPNLLEYASGSDPLAASTSPLALGQSGGRLTLTFPIQSDATLRYTVEASDDLSVWSAIFSGDGATLASGGATAKTVTDSVALSGRPRRFLRLVVSISP